MPSAYSPEINGTTIDALRYNGLTEDVADGITAALNKNGENAPTTDISWGGHKLTSLADSSANGDAVAWGQSTPVTLAGTLTLLGANLACDAITAGGNVVFGNALTDTMTVGVTGLFYGNSKVGIGTATPTYNLDLVGGSGVRLDIQNSADSNRGGYLRATTGTGFFLSTSSAVYPLRLGVDSVDKWGVDINGQWTPAVTNQNSIGLAGLRASNVFSVLGNFSGATTFSGLLTASAGVNFGGTTLATYTEGTFTPTIAFSGAAVGVTYTSQSGAYTRIGDRVFFELRCQVSSKGSSVGNLQILALPFAANGGGNSREQVVQLDYTGFSGLTGAMFGIILNGQTQVTVLQTAAAASANVTNTSVGASPDIYVSGSYHV